MVTDVMRASARQSFDRLSEMTVGEVARAVTTTDNALACERHGLRDRCDGLRGKRVDL